MAFRSLRLAAALSHEPILRDREDGSAGEVEMVLKTIQLASLTALTDLRQHSGLPTPAS